jgi:hypothetical protein
MRVVSKKYGTGGLKEHEWFTMQFNESSMQLPHCNKSNSGFYGYNQLAENNKNKG